MKSLGIDAEELDKDFSLNDIRIMLEQRERTWDIP